MSEFDYIIVGGGSAGVVLAVRLAEDSANRVLLIEAGGRGRNPLVRMPAGVLAIMTSRRFFQWPEYTEPQEHLDGRSLYYPRGRVLGGGSAINGAMWVRGDPSDYDEWDVPGWRYSDVLPMFKRSETWSEGQNQWRGGGGPIKVSKSTVTHELSSAFMSACRANGFSTNPDFNGTTADGVGSYDFSIHDGIRMSTAEAYLNSVEGRTHPTVSLRCQARRVLFEKGRAVGVEVKSGSRVKSFRATKEVILCCGAIGTPKLLMLSGIGNSKKQQSLGLPVVHHSPGVGENLQDHLQYSVQAKCKKPVTLYSQMSATAQISALSEWWFKKTGPATTIGVDCGGFVKSSAADKADIQINFMRANLVDHGRSPMKEHGFMAHACHVRPKSRGSVTLRSADPDVGPSIQPRYLSEEADRTALRDGVEIVREIFASADMRDFTGDEMFPGNEVQSQNALDAAIRKNCEPVWHAVGTCRMGEGSDAVVDRHGLVRGVEALRVADASIIPTITSGNTNAPVIMIAEMIAAKITGTGASTGTEILK